ncbi:ATP-binding cassette long-chain fatty acid transporter pxa2 [Yamadazyma tenuis]|uniref:ABC transporter domain-containing protein n=1 Tax=Candida tenuis (strain ATCC 10573 / BCRC 21748 / CBS 615 / JCM 9827 / NBRC 10315 / NRRL Y-1498 / VKM Y-70) TaxID=590646 RepID=G3B2A4_CANTC|nr:uncharacterized protein CANTEDRAFT_103191 [Yamadazyma tenuis ATCC 10573]EGV64628.1 hypothetical protein CANTEDRAFT_103191 [Yamadazyma tenuis ATCC 10573]WEJ97410.1 ATP-binding cassette long-chain fatty acid transporter pxa2 [Yamadazyma tenuis]
MSSPRSTNTLGVSLLNVYKSNRSLFLNASYIILITTAFSGATGTSQSSDKKPKDVESSTELPKKRKKLSKESTKRIFDAAIPHYTNAAVGFLISHIILLVIRAFLTIKVASLDGKLVGALVSKKLKKFGQLLAFWMFLGIPASIVNAMLNWTKSNLRKNLRINMTNSIVEDYLPDNLDANYYSLIQLNDSKIKDPDQRTSTDINRLASALSSLPGQLLKPTLDLLLCAKELSKSGVGSGEGTLALGLIAHFSTIILRFFSPPFAKLASERANLEGQLRSAHSKVVTNSEEIAFLRGHNRELDYLDYCYYQLERFLKMEQWKKAIHEIAQTFIVKYFWGAAGLVLCSAPVFINKYLGKEPDLSASGDFITNRRLLMSASDSLDRLIYARRYILQVVGHASRVSEFQDALHQIKQDKIAERKNEKSDNVRYGDEITFENVRLVTPADVTLIEKLDFSIKHGQHLLIAGPNGSGKSSLFRMLGGLWPCKEGQITIPETENMFYLPQRAYLCRGNLREQVIYPHTFEQYKKNKHGKTDKELYEIFKMLKLDDLLVGDRPWDEVRNWGEELSVGAQQRLAMARLFYHQPKFAVLDECTSAVSPTMEQFMYQHAQEMGISLLSVAHRPALWHFHNYLLKFDGKGGYFFGELDAEKRLKIEEERLKLEKSLRDVSTLRDRLQELKRVSNAQHIKYENSHKNLAQLGRDAAAQAEASVSVQ